ncbi:retinoic acid receptor responder protein 2-like [Rana temporaria]|uniref:retinoic acid receptor responder protein 2-like n=1 Tax=Rana temporaria TaxID=8407 RepID=UPI001AAC9D29|nr:retinoic acid receptor responder protein 2-like [Rana temporaria]XP_040211303.1 retinoic acid receptor responder protein 2-like [Rana temporaria]XP_040211304.1 retinoic acid receptor responder protein 2-like [Rana temporaria]XP_040211305.1 retinoic acid receptor responder protein 2-like [Rana temporaria]
MNLAAGWGLVSALLVLRVQADVLTEELSDNQNQMVRLVMEKFHQRDLQNAYRMTSVVKAEEVYNSGIFVNVEFLVKQTSCRKHDWSKPDCKVVKNARTYNCFGCYKFEYDAHSVISKVEECILTRNLRAGRQNQRNDLCKEVEKKDPERTIPGVYSFLKTE